ncbi:MAG: phage tail protein [Steroidobacteraceae bacterium]
MGIVQNGSINTTALLVPGVYEQIAPPPQQNLNGVPTNILGVIGTAAWGPKNSPVIVGTMAQYAAIFGALQARKYDMGTSVATAMAQGASNFRCVRVTDGTDTAAQVIVQTNGITFSSKYTGSLGNGASVSIAAGSQANTWKVVVGMPGITPESFDNIGAGLSGNAIWVAIAAAINGGTTALRGPSQLITATAGASATAPVVGTFSLAGGTDGVTTITGSVLVGTDGTTRTGLYALRGTGAANALLADCDDSTTWATQVAYGQSEGTEMVLTGPAGDTIANAITTKSTAGIDSPWAKLMFGDWVYWLDSYNNGLRLVSPQGFAAGMLSVLDPSESPLNAPLQAVAGTQKSNANQQYSVADLQSLVQAGIEVIANPSPGGAYFSCQFGHNTSSNPLTNGDAYTRMTDYLAATFNAGMGKFVGKKQTATLRQQAEATLGNFLSSLQKAEMIGNADGSSPAFDVTCDNTNNPQAQVALGFMQANVEVTYLAIVEKFLINLVGGTSVVVQRQSVQSLQAGA